MARFTDNYLLALMAQASELLSSEFHADLARQGVPVSTWRILATLSPDEPATIGELSRSCLAKQPTMTRQIERLEARGLVTREVSASDRRQVRVRLTDEGRSLAQVLTEKAAEHEARVIEGYGAKDVAQMKRFFCGILQAKDST